MVTIQHVKRHQDDVAQFDELSRWAQLNVLVDQEAKKRLLEFFMQGGDVRSSAFHGEGWTCWLGQMKCEDFTGKCLHRWIFQDKARHYWATKGLLSYQQFDDIDWVAIEGAISSKPHLFQLWHAKHHSGWCATGKNMKRWGFWSLDNCPCCLTQPELNPTHILKCSSPCLTQYRTEIYQTVLDWMEVQETHPDLLSAFRTILMGSSSVGERDGMGLGIGFLRRAKSIGRTLMRQGFLPRGMAKIQQGFYDHVGSRKTGKKWARSLCDKLIIATHNIWTKRNSIEHDRSNHGLQEVEELRLEKQVRLQYRLGTQNLPQSAAYLFRQKRQELWSQDGAVIRSWLAAVLIARGEHEQARRELTASRGRLGYVRSRPDARERVECLVRRRNKGGGITR